MSVMTEEDIRNRILCLSDQHAELNRQVDEQNKKQTMSDVELKNLKIKRCQKKHRMHLYEAKLMALAFAGEKVSAESVADNTSQPADKKRYASDFVAKQEGNDFTILQPNIPKQANFA